MFMQTQECCKDPLRCEYSEFVDWQLKGIRYILCRLRERKGKIHIHLIEERCPYPCQEWK